MESAPVSCQSLFPRWFVSRLNAANWDASKQAYFLQKPVDVLMQPTVNSAGIRVSRSIWDSFLWSDSKVLAVANISTREQNLTRHRSALHRVNVLSCFTSFPPLSAIQPPSFSFTVPLVAPPLPGGWWPGKSMPLPGLVALPLCRSSSLILAGNNPNRSTK